MIRNMSALLRCLLQGSVAAAVAIAGNCAWAQNFPQKLVRITEPYSSGGGPDLVARLFADRFSKLWKHQVIVDSLSVKQQRVGLDLSVWYRLQPDAAAPSAKPSPAAPTR